MILDLDTPESYHRNGHPRDSSEIPLQVHSEHPYKLSQKWTPLLIFSDLEAPASYLRFGHPWMLPKV